jgi:PHD/YefM family antitoxin component YafN of YafNO toxin-antitoxin module
LSELIIGSFLLRIWVVSSTYSVSEAQRNLPRLLKDATHRSIAIRRRDKTVAYLVSREKMEAIAETLELLANPAAMKAIRAHQAGRLKFFPLSSLDEAR